MQINLFIILFLLPLFPCEESKAEHTQKDMENIVQDLAKMFEANYSDWCVNDIATCESLSYIGCKGYKTKSCDKGFNKPSICLSEGALMSEASNLNFPSYMNLSNLSEEDMRFICSSAKLEKHFRQIAQTREKRFTYMYIGSNRGIFRLFPGEKYDCENNYDPRTKPWYSFAVLGVKNVVLLLDKGSFTKLDDIKLAASSIVDVLSINDNIGVLNLNDEFSMFGDHNLIPGTNTNKEFIKNKINNLIFAQHFQTDFEATLLNGFKFLNQSIEEGTGCSNPESIFIIFTQNGPDSNKQAAPFISQLEHFLKNPFSKLKRATIFIYTIGAIRNPLYLKELACNFNGTVFETPEKEDEQGQRTPEQKYKQTIAIAKNIEIFYEFLSSGLDVTEPRWTESYQDYFTAEEQFTVSMPVYLKNPENKLKKLIGVIGMNILFNYETSKESPCQKPNDACKVESLRSKIFQCNFKICQNKTNEEFPCRKIPSTSDIFINDDITRTDRICCGFTKVEFGLLLGFLLGFAVVLIICLIWQTKRFILCYRNWKKRKDYNEVEIIEQMSEDKKETEKKENKNSELSQSEPILEELEKRKKNKASFVKKAEIQKEQIKEQMFSIVE